MADERGSSGLQAPRELDDIIKSVRDWSAGLGLLIASLVIIYGAFLILTAGGNTEQFEKGKKAISYAVIGVVVLLFSAFIVAAIKKFIYG